MNAVKYLKTIGITMEDIMDVSCQTLYKIQVRNNPSDYATNTSISDRDLDQLVARIEQHHPINEFRCYEVKRPAAARSRTQDTSGLCQKCSATEPQQLDDHQPSQSLLYLEWENHSAWVLSWWRKFSGQALTEFWRHILSGCQVCDWGIQYHLAVQIEDCEGWWSSSLIYVTMFNGCHLA